MEKISRLDGGTASFNGDRAEPAEIWKARNFIHEQADDRLSLTKVAEAVKISPNSLSEKFKRVTGENFVAYISRRRVEKAQDLLRDSQLRISEIAFAIGFQSLSQFNRTFKKLTDKSPTELRAALRVGRHGFDEESRGRRRKPVRPA